MHPESAWTSMENALASAQSLSSVLEVRRADEHAGAHPRLVATLMAKKQAMYRERRKMAFDGVKAWSIVADPATHSKQEVLGTLIYSWEIGIAAHGDLQYLPMSKRLLSSEIDLPEHLGSLLAQERVERLASYRQLQAFSNVLANVGVVDGLDYFFLPSDYNLRPPTASELRVVVQGRAYLAERDAMMGEVPVLPASALASAQGHPLLVLSLDQGSIGAAGVGFAESLGMMIHAKWDKFHRLMRDINGALSGACGGAFLKARIFSAHLWAVNHKPFGTGLFSTAKVWMLNTFMALASAQSNVFR